MSEPRTLQAGDRLPDVTLFDAAGKPVRLRDRLGEKTLVVYFYPKDETPGCTAEACSFRDQYEDFVAAGAEVIGVSADDGESHTKFSAHHRLPFLLLSDRDGAGARAFGVKRAWFGLLGGRVTFVIDRGGTIRHVRDSIRNATEHVTESLQVVRKLESERAGAPASP